MKTGEKINKETEAAGVPWWAGLFNPEIVKLASGEGCECNCAKDEPESARCSETDGKPEESMEERQVREFEEQEGRLRRADEAVVKAIEAASESVEWGRRRLEEKEMNIFEQSTTMEWMVKNAETVAKLRQSMNGLPFYGV